jgi:hypothetical protein
VQQRSRRAGGGLFSGSLTSQTRKAEIEQQLLAYCALDTYAMVRLWAAFSGTSLKV